MAKIIFYDTETTGTRFDKDRVIELAGFDPIEKRTFLELINPKCPIPPEASAIHRITDEMVQNALPFEEVGKAFASFCTDDAILVAHNNDSFDKLFIEAEFKQCKLSLPPWRYVDTLKWSRKYRPDLPRHSLQHLRQTYGIAANNAHRALDDVMVLYEVFCHMIDDLDMETVIKLLAQKEKALRMPFGKHQGKPLSEIPKDYVRWLKENGALDKPQNKDLREAFEQCGLLR
jgi:DNA polymerase-3 subunit epsilon